MSIVFKGVTLLGLAILAVFVILAILSLTGQFDPAYTNPPS